MLRPAAAADLPALAAIDAAGNPAPWTAAQFQAACAAPHQHVCLLEENGQIRAFAVWQRVLDETELHLIATAPAQRRQGYATRLLEALFADAAAHGVQRIFLEVRAGNAAAQSLYRRHGFTVAAVRKRYYGGTEDAVIMEKSC